MPLALVITLSLLMAFALFFFFSRLLGLSKQREEQEERALANYVRHNAERAGYTGNAPVVRLHVLRP